MNALAKALNRPFFMPKVPAFLMKLMLGEMAALVLNSTNASNEKVKNAGFIFQHEDIEATLSSFFKR
jgi:NAD dependent epimerase/dehydratase family enzyme